MNIKTRIIEIIDTEYGEKTRKFYDLQYFKRNWFGVVCCLIIPVYGWLWLLNTLNKY